MPGVTLHLLGGFVLRGGNGAAIDLPTRKARILLAFLALPAGVAHGREKLTGLFWGNRGDEQARGSLRHALVAMRAALGAEALDGLRETVALVPGALDIDTDLLAEAAGHDGPPAADAIEAALRGELLEGLSLPSDAVTEWLAFERARCRSLAATVLRKAVQAREAAGQLVEAASLAERLVALDPLREQSHRLLMGVFAAMGERSRAASQFQRLKDLLKRELNVEPAPETVALAHALATSVPPPATPTAAPTPPRAPMAAAPVAPSARFTLAVLPFVSMGGEPDDRFVAEGFSEDLITELSRLRDFEVIARQSSYQFSGRAETAAAAASELGARFALVGSLRRAGERLRVTTQLIDAGANRCIWAERYDRSTTDLFAVQDEIVAQVVGNVDAEIRHDERERAARLHPQSLDAWALFHRGLWHAYRFGRDDISQAEEYFARAIAEAPGFALPHGGLGYAAVVKVMWFYAADPRSVMAEGIAHAARGVALDDSNAFCHGVLGRLCAIAGQIDRALHHLAIATDRNPSFAPGYYGLAQALCWAGRPDEALAAVDRALQLSPKDPLTGMILTLRAFCHFCLGDPAAAAAGARASMLVNPRETWARLLLAGALVELGAVEQAREVVEEARQIQPAITLATFRQVILHAPGPILDRATRALSAAGLA